MTIKVKVPILGSEMGGEKVNVFEEAGGIGFPVPAWVPAEGFAGFPVPAWVPAVSSNAENRFGLLS